VITIQSICYTGAGTNIGSFEEDAVEVHLSLVSNWAPTWLLEKQPHVRRRKLSKEGFITLSCTLVTIS